MFRSKVNLRFGVLRSKPHPTEIALAHVNVNRP
jgi:hypothetical protein